MSQNQFVQKLKKDQVLCLEGEMAHDLFIVQKGKLLVCGLKGSQVTPYGILKVGDYFGEFSFFDRGPRSANVICMEDSELVKIPSSDLTKTWPNWLITLIRGMTFKIRSLDQSINKKGIKKRLQDPAHGLTIQDQAHYYKILKSV